MSGEREGWEYSPDKATTLCWGGGQRISTGKEGQDLMKGVGTWPDPRACSIEPHASGGGRGCFKKTSNVRPEKKKFQNMGDRKERHVKEM